MLGPGPAALVGLFTGIFTALWETHDPFTPLVIVFLALLCGVALRQPYRTPVFRLLRHPLATSLLLALVFPLIQIPVMILNAQGALAPRLDYALSSLISIWLASAIELAVAGLIAEVLKAIAPAPWSVDGALQPSPAERSLQTRFLTNMTPLAILLVLALFFGDYLIAGRAARSMVESRLSTTAEMAAQNVPYFLETGQNLLIELSRDPRLLDEDPEELQTTLAQLIQLVPFFDQLAVYDAEGEPFTSYPSGFTSGSQSPLEEQMAIQSALQGMPFLTATAAPASGENTARVSFIAALGEADDPAQRVLVGRSSLENNPLTAPLTGSLQSLSGSDGLGILIDENSRILIHPDPALVMTRYVGPEGRSHSCSMTPPQTARAC